MGSNSDVRLHVAAEGKNEDAIQDLARDLIRTLREETDIAAEFDREAAQPGARGDAMAIGNLVLQLASSTAVVALVGVLKSYFDRTPTLSLEFEGKDGTKVKVSGQHLQTGQVDKLIGELKKLASR